MSVKFLPFVDQPESFAFSEANSAEAQRHIAKYPAGRQASAVMPLLTLAQKQHGWLPRAAMDCVADMLGMPHIKVYEVATFYSMYNLAPIGKHYIEVCTTTPCWLRGSADIVDACSKKLGIGLGQTTLDKQFTLVEVECLGACVAAPMLLVDETYYEDLTPDSVTALIDDLAAGRQPQAGSQRRKYDSMNDDGATTLKAEAEAANVPFREVQDVAG